MDISLYKAINIYVYAYIDMWTGFLGEELYL